MSRVIDYWCNIFTPEGIRACFTEPAGLAEVFRSWKLEDHLEGYSSREFVGVLDRAGVEMGWSSCPPRARCSSSDETEGHGGRSSG